MAFGPVKGKFPWQPTTSKPARLPPLRRASYCVIPSRRLPSRRWPLLIWRKRACTRSRLSKAQQDFSAKERRFGDRHVSLDAWRFPFVAGDVWRDLNRFVPADDDPPHRLNDRRRRVLGIVKRLPPARAPERILPPQIDEITLAHFSSACVQGPVASLAEASPTSASPPRQTRFRRRFARRSASSAAAWALMAFQILLRSIYAR